MLLQQYQVLRRASSIIGASSEKPRHAATGAFYWGDEYEPRRQLSKILLGEVFRVVSHVCLPSDARLFAC
jgi:hypothetical protein